MDIMQIASLALRITSPSMNTKDSWHFLGKTACYQSWETLLMDKMLQQVPFEQLGLHISSYQSPKLGIIIQIWKKNIQIFWRSVSSVTEKPVLSIRKLICFFFPFWYLRLLALFIWHNLIESRGYFPPSANPLPVVLSFLWSKEKGKKGREDRKTWFGPRLLLRAQIGPGTGDKREIIIQPAEAWQLLSSPRVKEMKHYNKNQLAKHRQILTPPFRVITSC